MLIQYLYTAATHIIEIMTGMLLVALLFRFLAYRAGKRNLNYYKTFARVTEKQLQKQGRNESVADVESWMNQLLESVTAQLPSRSVRNVVGDPGSTQKSFRHRDKKTELFTEFAEGRKAVSHAVRMQIDSFKNPHPPNFSEITERVLNSDRKWHSLLGLIPVNTVSSMLSILPGLFIVGGIFGTFIGITAALPKVAAIDLSNLDAAAPILSAFVSDVAYSMNTSIAGIICSVIMTVLNTLFPFNQARNEVRRNLERCFQLIWTRIHGTEMSPAEQKTVDLLRKMNEHLAAIARGNDRSKAA